MLARTYGGLLWFALSGFNAKLCIEIFCLIMDLRRFVVFFFVLFCFVESFFSKFSITQNITPLELQCSSEGILSPGKF